MAIEKLTIQEAATYLNVHTETIRRRIKKGEMKAEKQSTKFGEQWLIPFDEVTKGTLGGESSSSSPCEEFGNMEEILHQLTSPLYNQLQLQNKLLLKQSQVIESLEEKLQHLEREMKKVRVDLHESSNTLQQAQNTLKTDLELSLSGHNELLQDTLLETLESDFLERRMMETETNHVLEFIRLGQTSLNQTVQQINDDQKRLERQLEHRDVEIVSRMRSAQHTQTKKRFFSKLLPIRV